MAEYKHLQLINFVCACLPENVPENKGIADRKRMQPTCACSSCRRNSYVPHCEHYQLHYPFITGERDFNITDE